MVRPLISNGIANSQETTDGCFVLRTVLRHGYCIVPAVHAGRRDIQRPAYRRRDLALAGHVGDRIVVPDHGEDQEMINHNLKHYNRT